MPTKPSLTKGDRAAFQELLRTLEDQLKSFSFLSDLLSEFEHDQNLSSREKDSRVRAILAYRKLSLGEQRQLVSTAKAWSPTLKNAIVATLPVEIKKELYTESGKSA